MFFELNLKRDVRDSVVQIGNHKSNSEMMIQSETASNAGETENHSMDQLEAIHQREHKDVRQWQERKELRKYWKRGQSLLSVLQCYSKCKIGVLQGHGSHTPLQDECCRSL